MKKSLKKSLTKVDSNNDIESQNINNIAKRENETKATKLRNTNERFSHKYHPINKVEQEARRLDEDITK